LKSLASTTAKIIRGSQNVAESKHGRTVHFLKNVTLLLDFFCPCVLSTLYYKWIYEDWNSVFKETN